MKVGRRSDAKTKMESEKRWIIKRELTSKVEKVRGERSERRNEGVCRRYWRGRNGGNS